MDRGRVTRSLLLLMCQVESMQGLCTPGTMRAPPIGRRTPLALLTPGLPTSAPKCVNLRVVHASGQKLPGRPWNNGDI